MKKYSRHSKSTNKPKKYTRKSNKTTKRCKHGCRTKDCGHTPFLYGGNGPNDFQRLDDLRQNLAVNYTPFLYGGNGPNDFQRLDDLGQNLAYTGEKVPVISPNPHFAYVPGQKGGSGSPPLETSDLTRAYPVLNNQYVPGNPTVNWLNSNTMSGGKRVRRKKMRGGGYGCAANNNAYGSLAYVPGQVPLMKGGGCGMCSTSAPMQKGGSFYKDPLPYPNGLVGTAWTPKISSWPGVDGVSGDSNYYPLNTYAPVDISREMIATGASKPFVSGGASRKTKKQRRQMSKKMYKGGNWYTNSFAQDLVNLGRSTFYNANTTLNALKGVPAPVNPLPWKDQLK